MELIDNINRLLGDDIKQALKPGAKLKVAASCFSSCTPSPGLPRLRILMSCSVLCPGNG